jgi:hypothetical protein
MSLFVKWLGASLLCALPFWIVIDVATPKRLERESIAVPLSRVEERVGAFASATKRLFTAQVSQNPIGDSFLASDPAHLAARDRYLKTVFTMQGRHHLYEISGGANSAYYEIKGLALVGPRARTIDKAAKLLGINASLVYRYRAEAHRKLEKGAEASPWIPGLPPGLEGFTVVRQGWDWNVQEGPVRDQRG